MLNHKILFLSTEAQQKNYGEAAWKQAGAIVFVI